MKIVDKLKSRMQLPVIGSPLFTPQTSRSSASRPPH